jgi:putative ABC transport system permease protein
MAWLTPTVALRLTLFYGALREQPVKWLIATLAIAVGVGLGLAVHLIHLQALTQFNSGVRQFSGQADLQFLPHSQTLPDQALELVSALPAVAVASPVLDLQVQINGVNNTVRWLGLDVFTAAQVTPNLIGQGTVAGDPSLGDIPFLSSDNVYISPALKEQLSPNTSDLFVQVNGKASKWMIAGDVPAAGAGQLIAVADIAAVQWKMGALGKLSRVDLKLREGVSPQQFQREMAQSLAQYGRLETPSEQGSRGASVSQAYRANLSILAMVALLTGGFLTFSTQMLAVAQRARQWALLAAMGVAPSQLRRQVLFESACCGVVGGLLGVALGWVLANAIVSTLGVDLGAGYFESTRSRIALAPLDGVLFATFGLVATVLGGISPAFQTGRLALAQRLRAGQEEAGLRFANKAHWLGLGLCVLALGSLFIPPQGSVPVGGYLAVGFGLFGGIALIGLFVRWFIPHPKQLNTLGDLAQSRLASTPNLLAIGLSGVVASFALVIAMHVMIFSFRFSLDNWLNQVLPAPLYLKVNNTEVQSFPLEFQAKVAQLDSIGEVEFWGQQPLIVDPLRPSVEIIVRPLTPAKANERLPMTGRFDVDVPTNALPAWISEPVSDLYGKHVGDTMRLRLDQGQEIDIAVLGIWRDYTRQHGAIVLPKNLLESRHNIRFKDTQAAVWPKDQQAITAVINEIEQIAVGGALHKQLSFSQPGEIRELSLDIFDRSFAVTYLLELAAVVIGLFGVATTFSAMAIQRRREFALLGAMGASRGWLMRLISVEALKSSTLAAGIGLTIGLAFAAILIFVVNPQSFHWTMQWHTPWLDLFWMSLILVATSGLTVVLALRKRLGSGLIGQLKEDWS